MKQILRCTIFLASICLSSCSSSQHPLPTLASHSTPPTVPVLLVTPAHALVNDKPSLAYAQDIATALANDGVLTTDNRANNQNWQLQISKTQQDNVIIPTYQILGPNKKTYADMAGTPISQKDWETIQQSKLLETASTDSVKISKLLAGINNTVQQNNPNSLANRPPVLFIGPTFGAPGAGDTTLSSHLTEVLKTAPLKLTSSKEDADFSVSCNVKLSSPVPDKNIAEINWIIRDSGNRLVGQVTQLHEIKPSASLNFWDSPPASEIQEAAAGILTVIHNDTVKTKKTALH